MTVIRHTNEAKQKISEGVKRYIREHGPYRVNSKHSEMAKRKISEGLLRFFHNNAYARHTLRYGQK
jgi:hypothetical protein